MSGQDILIAGESGQLARALKNIGNIGDHRLICAGRPALDITRPETIARILEDIKPALVINAAAYTAVDKAESDAATAFAVNASGVGELGRQCARRNIPIIHVSTDYVFDGTAQTPYKPTDEVAPNGVYGRSKLQGEVELRNATRQHLIFRTAWVFSEYGNNFLTTMLRLGKTRDPLRIVSDQRGTPTYADDLARGLAQIASQLVSSRDTITWGTYHLTNSGDTSWFGFATEIFKNCPRPGAAGHQVCAITTQEYPTAAVRPAYSILDCGTTAAIFNVSLPDWRDATTRCIQKIEGIH